jgi:serine/threonine protein kinase
MTESAVSRSTLVDKTLLLRREVKACPDCKQRFSAEATFCPFDGAKLALSRYEAPVDPLVGTSVDGRYQVMGLLGEGGMGTVYEVRHKMLGRTFAMKVLRRDIAREEDLAARFINEAKATGSIKHPHIVSITDFGHLDDKTPYFVMEMLVGQTLAQVLKQEGALEMSRAHAILLQLSGALAQAHSSGVIHRDLKPENVFLARPAVGVTVGLEDDVRIVDFGAAKVIGTSRITKTGIVFGTPHYMSPEQASGQPVDHRADIYALGVIMYEMLTGRVPFEAETYMGVLTQHMFVRPKPPSTLRQDQGTELGALEDITLRALEKKPEDRYQTMHGLAADLEKASRGESVTRAIKPSSLRPPPGEMSGPPSASRSRISAPVSLPPGVNRPATMRTAALMGALVGMMVVGLLLLVRGKVASSTTASIAPRASVPAAASLPAPAAASSAPPEAVAPTPTVASVAASVSAIPSVPRSAPPPRITVGSPERRVSAPPDRSTPRRASSGGELSDPWAK